MEHPYTIQLINNLTVFYKDSGITFMHYPHIDTIRIILPSDMVLRKFAKNLLIDLSKLPEIEYPREMVYFWIGQVDSADFYKELINPTEKAELDWNLIGTGPDTWVQIQDLNKYK